MLSRVDPLAGMLNSRYTGGGGVSSFGRRKFNSLAGSADAGRRSEERGISSVNWGEKEEDFVRRERLNNWAGTRGPPFRLPTRSHLPSSPSRPGVPHCLFPLPVFLATQIDGFTRPQLQKRICEALQIDFKRTCEVLQTPTTSPPRSRTSSRWSPPKPRKRFSSLPAPRRRTKRLLMHRLGCVRA